MYLETVGGSGDGRVVIGRLRQSRQRFIDHPDQTGLTVQYKADPETQVKLETAVTEIKTGVIIVGVIGAIVAAALLYDIATRKR